MDAECKAYYECTTDQQRATCCTNIMTAFRTLVNAGAVVEDVLLLSHLAQVSLDCGAMVMLGFDKQHARFVVVKSYIHESAKWTLPAQVLHQLRASVNIHTCLTNPKCLQRCFDVSISENSTQMFFEYYPLLFSAVFRAKSLLSPLARGVARELLQAVRLLHRAKVYHRDIKPENICFDMAGNLVLIDFDSSATETPFRYNVPVCSLLTRAPEQIALELGLVETKSVCYDSRAGDWWACGCVIAQLFLGETLFSVCATLHAYYIQLIDFCVEFQKPTTVHKTVKLLRRCLEGDHDDVAALLRGLLHNDIDKRQEAADMFLDSAHPSSNPALNPTAPIT